MAEVNETGLGRIKPFGDYVACHRSGPDFRGPTVGVAWRDGVSVPLKGYQVKRFGVVHYARVFEIHEGFAPVWVAGAWRYLSDVRDLLPKTPEPADNAPPDPPPPEERPAGPAQPTRRRVRRVRCLGCDELFLRDELADGRCGECS